MIHWEIPFTESSKNHFTPALSILKIDLLDFFVIQASLWKKEQSLISIITSLYQY